MSITNDSERQKIAIIIDDMEMMMRTVPDSVLDGSVQKVRRFKDAVNQAKKTNCIKNSKFATRQCGAQRTFCFL